MTEDSNKLKLLSMDTEDLDREIEHYRSLDDNAKDLRSKLREKEKERSDTDVFKTFEAEGALVDYDYGVKMALGGFAIGLGIPASIAVYKLATGQPLDFSNSFSTYLSLYNANVSLSLPREYIFLYISLPTVASFTSIAMGIVGCIERFKGLRDFERITGYKFSEISQKVRDLGNYIRKKNLERILDEAKV